MSDNTIRFANDGSTVYGGMTVNTPYETDKKDAGVKVEDFLQLMIAQMTNQDFMNPVDDTQYITQMAQFATMESMQELSYYSQTNYVTGLIGKSVTVASLGLGGQVSSDTGTVSSVSLNGDKYLITVNGKQYELSQIMNVSAANSATTQDQLDNASKMSPIVQSTGTNSITIRWDAPVSDEKLAGELRYDVYITENGMLDMDTASGVKKATLDGEGLKNLEHTFSGLTPGKTYFVNIIVRNGSGAEAVYQHTAIPTKVQ